MRLSAVDKRNGWRKWFLLFPAKIGDEWVWLEWIERRFCGLYYEVRSPLDRKNHID